jgi:hypothetical protein
MAPVPHLDFLKKSLPFWYTIIMILYTALPLKFSHQVYHSPLAIHTQVYRLYYENIPTKNMINA